MCELDDRMLPCVDFGHMNSRLKGGMNSREEFEALLDEMKVRLGEERTNRMHVHFSKIEYSAGGEVRHLTFEDQVFGPDYVPLMELFVQRKMEPVVICESAGTQTADALAMQLEYQSRI